MGERGVAGLEQLGGPIQHFRAAILEGWRSKVSNDFCARKGFRGGGRWGVFRWMLTVPCNSLTLAMFGREIRLRSGVSLLAVLEWFSSSRQPVPRRFCGAPDGDGHIFWECPFPPLVEIREHPEFFMISLSWISRLGLGVCFGMDGCLFFLE